jgi:hypothetical protein
VSRERRELHDHLGDLTRPDRLHKGHSPHKPPAQGLADRTRNGPGHEARAFLALGDAERAERAASAALNASDEDTYPRNHAIYAGLRARALIERGRVDDAIAAAVPVVARVSTLASRRIATEARVTVQLLRKYRHYEPAVSFTAWADGLLPAA